MSSQTCRSSLSRGNNFHSGITTLADGLVFIFIQYNWHRSYYYAYFHHIIPIGNKVSGCPLLKATQIQSLILI